MARLTTFFPDVLHVISEEGFLRVGPAMAIHFMIANAKKIREMKQAAKESAKKAKRPADGTVEQARRHRSNTHLATQPAIDAAIKGAGEDEKESEDAAIPVPEGFVLDRFACLAKQD